MTVAGKLVGFFDHFVQFFGAHLDGILCGASRQSHHHVKCSFRSVVLARNQMTLKNVCNAPEHIRIEKTILLATR
eukprot:m.303318 g.303318  ORF g.303318 m.303318 type:complete len:75 (-) comp20163_c0_seq6:51-275(-)